ncbi:unnamed protein product [Amoebophrya sp. A25]|nr:unnamed protein product [Amoebophrya sp. A25]|eukprot:GSA25T00004967001.1
MPSSVENIVTAQLGVKQALPWAFIEGFLVQFSCAWGFFFISCLASPLVWGEIPDERKLLWHTTFVALCQPFYSAYAIWDDVAAVVSWWWQNPMGDWLDYKPTPGIFYGVGLACGFMAMDTMTLAIWPKTLMKALRRSMFIQMLIHHILSLIFWPYALCTQKGAVPILYFVLTEASNIFVNLRWLLENRPGWDTSSAYYITGISMLFVFFIIRVLPMPWIAFHWVRPSSYAHCSTFQTMIFLLLLPIPLYLNAFWFKLMVKKAIRVITKALVSSEVERKSEMSRTSKAEGRAKIIGREIGVASLITYDNLVLPWLSGALRMTILYLFCHG